METYFIFARLFIYTTSPLTVSLALFKLQLVDGVESMLQILIPKIGLSLLHYAGKYFEANRGEGAQSATVSRLIVGSIRTRRNEIFI